MYSVFGFKNSPTAKLRKASTVNNPHIFLVSLFKIKFLQELLQKRRLLFCTARGVFPCEPKMDLPSSTHPHTNGSDSQHKATKTQKKLPKFYCQTFFANHFRFLPLGAVALKVGAKTVVFPMSYYIVLCTTHHYFVTINYSIFSCGASPNRRTNLSTEVCVCCQFGGPNSVARSFSVTNLDRTSPTAQLNLIECALLLN